MFTKQCLFYRSNTLESECSETDKEGMAVKDIMKLKEVFKNIFHEDFERVFFAPGRINLIGEHIDYNGGHVFPAALTFGTYALVRRRTDRQCRFYSMNFPEAGVFTVPLGELDYQDAHGWVNYPKAMLRYMLDGREPSFGLDFLYFGDIPNGAGLSSSASIELVTAVALNAVYDLNFDQLDLVKFGQRAENEYIRVNSGIMDQYAVGMGKKNQAMLLDCDTLECTYAPFEFEDVLVVIMNTNKRRELADSKYNERRKECDTALEVLNQELNIRALCDLDSDTLEERQVRFEDETIYRRARHVVSENERTREALRALQAGDVHRFGELMNASHRSLDKDYDVTGVELNTLVESAWRHGAIGARMTGAGFGGCAIALVREHEIPRFIDEVTADYERQIGYAPTCYVASIGEGAHEIKGGSIS